MASPIQIAIPDRAEACLRAGAHWRGPLSQSALRAQRDLLNRIKLMLPVQSPSQKYFRSRLTQITHISFAIPAHTQGAFRDRHERRAGDAMDAGGAADESAISRTAKSCGPDAPTLASSLAEATPRGDGGNKARSPGRARSKPLTPSRAGMPGDPGATVVTNARAYYSTRAAAGATGTRHSPRPLSGEEFMHNSGAIRAAGMRTCVDLRHRMSSFALRIAAMRRSGRRPGVHGSLLGGASDCRASLA